MAELIRGKIIKLEIHISSVDNGWIFDISWDGYKIREKEILVARSRSELNEIIDKIPKNLINRVDSELMEDSS